MAYRMTYTIRKTPEEPWDYYDENRSQRLMELAQENGRIIVHGGREANRHSEEFDAMAYVSNRMYDVDPNLELCPRSSDNFMVRYFGPPNANRVNDMLMKMTEDGWVIHWIEGG